ncbi:MAG: YidC/Oxa1 family insertase periplasmic-domain containing protein [Planctomycetes bacterium]|nr:YidC/Oxa1 family insertase periplasmic-domain containing protein [Planctomycetota bacterium]
MDKRLLIALPLCFLILFGWQYLFGKKPEPRPTPAAGQAAAVDGATGNAPTSSIAGERGAAPTDSNAPVAAETAKDAAGNDLARVADTEVREEVLEVGKPGQPGCYRAVFTNKGAGLVELRNGAYVDRAGYSPAEMEDWRHWVPIAGNTSSVAKDRPLSFALRTQPNSDHLRRASLEEELWQMKVLETDGVRSGIEFTLAPGTGVTFTKRFRFLPGKNQLVLELELANDALATQSGVRTFDLTPSAWMVADSGDSYYIEPQAVAGWREKPAADVECNSIPRDPSGGELAGVLASAPPGSGSEIAYVGVHSKYFTLLLAPAKDGPKSLVGAGWRKVRDNVVAAKDPEHAYTQIVADTQVELALPRQGERTKLVFDVYAGPKEPDALAAASADFASLHRYDLGWVRVISAPLLSLLKLFHWLCSSWGVSIILLTLLVRLILFPVNRRSQTAMARYTAKMKRLQPKIEELKKRYESDPSKLRTEQARLMQQEGAFPPLGGCLPMFLQIPVFIGLYKALGISFDLRQEPFMGWIHDLSLPDQLVAIDLHLWPFGLIPYLNILPPIMVALWIWQQKMMPAPADEQAARMQKMMMFMPLMMGVFLYNYAAGLSLYMITQSGLAIIEMKVIRKYWPIDDKDVPPKKDGFFAKMIALQEQAEAQKRARGRAR